MISDNNDLLMCAIQQWAKRLVKDGVEVSVYYTEPTEYYSKYTLQLDYANWHTYYKLDNEFSKNRSYIMRVVSDLCNNLAKMTQRPRNDFYNINWKEE